MVFQYTLSEYTFENNISTIKMEPCTEVEIEQMKTHCLIFFQGSRCFFDKNPPGHYVHPHRIAEFSLQPQGNLILLAQEFALYKKRKKKVLKERKKIENKY